MGLDDAIQRLRDWLRAGWGDATGRPWSADGTPPPTAAPDVLEYPWRHRWDFLPKRTAGFGFTSADYAASRARAEEVARLTLGDDVWRRVKRVGYLDVPSKRLPGVTYRLRVGRRIEVRCEPGVQPPWPYPFLCINPTYPLPEAEFFAHLVLYVRDHEELVIQVAAPQPWDQPLGRTFS
jgi:hypothetical protein